VHTIKKHNQKGTAVHSMEEITPQGESGDAGDNGDGGDGRPGLTDRPVVPIKKRRGPRRMFSSEQVELLQQKFQQMQYPDELAVEELAKKIGSPEARIRTWFTNRRQNLRRKASSKAAVLTLKQPSSGANSLAPAGALATCTVKPSSKYMPKDPAAPSRPLSSYHLFCQEQRTTVHADLKQWGNGQGAGGGASGEIWKELGRRWRALPKPEARRYTEAGTAASEAYQRALATYRTSDQFLRQKAARLEVGRKVQHYAAGRDASSAVLG
jgi:hypothetical protein